MSLLEEHKAERRARILAAARELIAERGYDGLTMRDLAQASRVSVPTLYNLFGGKQAILLGELEETFERIVASTRSAPGGSAVERAFTGCEAANRELLAEPGYSRALVHLFLTSAEARPLRRKNRDRYVAMMAGELRCGQAAGDVVPWVDTTVVATHIYARYVQAMIEWAQGELDADEFRSATLVGQGLILLGVMHGRARRELERRLRQLQTQTAPARTGRARKRR